MKGTSIEAKPLAVGGLSLFGTRTGKCVAAKQGVACALETLMLKLLEYNTKENISGEEQENLGVLLIAINCIIFFASGCTLLLPTPCEARTDFTIKSKGDISDGTVEKT